MAIHYFDHEAAENFQVLAEIRLLNKYVQRVKKIAISAISPVYSANASGEAVRALNIRVEGPKKHISYFHRLIDEANLKIR
tara:strand:- start:399 stop:641 length:243 start_codon:yes stop_codon:yes gene_type:complete